MTVVVDASVACKWFFQEADSGAARKVLASIEPLLAPDLLLIEVGNVGWKKVRAGAATEQQLLEVGAILPAGFAEIVPTVLLLPRALEIALELEHPVYDCLYVALAERADCRLVTADARLVRTVDGTRWKRRVKLLR